MLSIKRNSQVGGNTPVGLVDGECEINDVDGIIYFMDDTGVLQKLQEGLKFHDVAGVQDVIALINSGVVRDGEMISYSDGGFTYIVVHFDATFYLVEKGV